MTKCPSCGATLPDAALHCQFCGTQFGVQAPGGRPMGRTVGGLPMPAPTQGFGPGRTARWVVLAYNGVAVWWLVNGAWQVYRAASDGSMVAVVSGVVGLITALIGLGLLLRVEAARGVVNILCFIQILTGLMAVGAYFTVGAALGLLAVVGLLMAFVQVGLAGLMIFLIGETETRAPNF